MTREEAIHKWVFPAIKNTWNEKRCEEILKALDQEPSGDMVSRGAFEQVKWERDTAIAQLKELGYGLGEKPKTGHWIHFASSDDCSECGWSTGKYVSPSKYCPNCGAKMETSE